MIKNSRGHGNEVAREKEKSQIVLNYPGRGDGAGGIHGARKQFARNLVRTDIPEPRMDLVPGQVVWLAINRFVSTGVIPLDRLAAR